MPSVICVEVKFEEGDLTTSLLLNLKMAFYRLGEKNLKLKLINVFM